MIAFFFRKVLRKKFDRGGTLHVTRCRPMKKLEATCESVRVMVMKRNNKSPLVTFLSSFF